jgi:hypothetical protein
MREGPSRMAVRRKDTDLAHIFKDKGRQNDESDLGSRSRARNTKISRDYGTMLVRALRAFW